MHFIVLNTSAVSQSGSQKLLCITTCNKCDKETLLEINVGVRQDKVSVIDGIVGAFCPGICIVTGKDIGPFISHC